MFQLRLTAVDTAYPTEIATATVDIRVTRNINPPQFTQSPYRVILNETAGVGVGIMQISATDADGVSYHVLFNNTIVFGKTWIMSH